MKSIKKIVSAVLAAAMVLTMTPAAKADAKVEKYNGKYMLVQETQYSSGYGDKKLHKFETHKYEYNKNGDVTKDTSSRYNRVSDGKSALDYKRVITRSYKKGIQVKSTDTYSDYVSKTTLNKKNQMTKTETTYAGELRKVEKYTYKKGKLYYSEQKDVVKGFVQWKFWYYADGTVKKRVLYNEDGTVDNYHEYDKYGNLTAEVYYRYDENGKQSTIASYTFTNTYTKNGVLKKVVSKCKDYYDDYLTTTTETTEYYTSGYRKGFEKSKSTVEKSKEGTYKSGRVYAYKADKSKKNVAVKVTKDKSSLKVLSKIEYKWKKIK